MQRLTSPVPLEKQFSFVFVTQGHIADADLGPVISPQAKERISRLVQSGIDEGAKCILDGRGIVVPGFEKGNFVGPTILSDVKVNFILNKTISKHFMRLIFV